MKAWITGAGGQLGRALLAEAPASWTCIGSDRGDLDLRDPKAIRRAIAHHAPDIILNAGAYTAVDRAEAEEPAAFAINCEAVGIIAESARECQAHLVHISTDFVFDGSSSRACRPDDRRNPLSAYGRTKAAGEDAVRPCASIVRTAWVYGASGANFVHTMLGLMRSRNEVSVVSDQIGAPTWATSLAQVVWGVAVARLPKVWHYTDAGVASRYDFAVAIHEEALALGLLERPTNVLPIATADYPTLARRPRFSLLDSSDTLAVLARTPVHWRSNLRAMLREMATSDQ